MDTNTILTVFLGICAVISAGGGAFSYLYKAKKKIAEPDELRDSRITNCEKRLDDNDQKIKDVYAFLKSDKRRIESLEGELKAANAVQMQCLLALLKHARNPADTTDVDSATRTLEQYMINRDAR